MISIELVSGRDFIEIGDRRVELLDLQGARLRPPIIEDGNLLVPLVPFCLAVGYSSDCIIIEQGGAEVKIIRPQGGVACFAAQRSELMVNGSLIPIVNEAGRAVRSVNRSGVLMVYSRSISPALGFTVGSSDTHQSITYLAEELP